MFKGFLRTVASTLLAVAILVTVVRPVPLAASSHKSDLEPAAVQELVTRALEARWNMLVNPKTPLEHFYHPDTQSLAAQERERVERHYLQPAHRAGFRYTDVELGAKFESIEVKGNTALVKAVVDVSYTSEYPGDPLPIMSKVAGLEHVISLIHQDGQWHIADDQYFDTFSKRGQKGPGVPSVSADGIPDTRLKDETAQDVIPLWYHYNPCLKILEEARGWSQWVNLDLGTAIMSLKGITTTIAQERWLTPTPGGIAVILNTDTSLVRIVPTMYRSVSTMSMVAKR